MTEEWGKYYDRYLTPPEPENCDACADAGCDGEGYEPAKIGEPKIPCCGCAHHGDPEDMKRAAEWERYEAMKEEGA